MLRYSRFMTQADLVDGIISLRQFRRYLNGTYRIPQYVINEFSYKLGFKPAYLILEFESARIKETQSLNEFHNHIVNGNYAFAQSMLQEGYFKFVFDQNNEKIFKYSLILLNYYTKKITESDAIYQTKKLVNYEKVLKNTVFSSTEMIILTSLMSYPHFDEKDKVAKLIEFHIDNPNLIISGHNSKMLLLCIHQLTEFYGINQNYDSVINYSKRGVDIALKTKSNYLLVDFYYFLSLAYFAINDLENYQSSLFKCYGILYAESNPSKIKKYYQLIEDDFNIDFDKFITSYINQKNKNHID